MSRVGPDYKPRLVQKLFEKLVKVPTNPTQEELDRVAEELREHSLREWNERSGK